MSEANYLCGKLACRYRELASMETCQDAERAGWIVYDPPWLLREARWMVYEAGWMVLITGCYVKPAGRCSSLAGT